MANTDYLDDHEKYCKENPDYTRSILKQHMRILSDDIEKMLDLYENIKIELKALLEEEDEK